MAIFQLFAYENAESISKGSDFLAPEAFLVV